MDDPPTRRLAAILAADVVGYSRLMGFDEEGTLRRIKALRTAIIEPQLASKFGRLVKTTGDGFLIEFVSVISAFRFAVDVQELLAKSELGHANEAIRLRIGINVGEIIADDDGDVFGDGVNVAARLEQICPVGGICVSERAWRDLRQLGVEFVALGPQKLKNIRDAIQAYTFLPGEPIKKSSKRLVRFNISRQKFWAFSLIIVITACTILIFMSRDDQKKTSLLVKSVVTSRSQLSSVAMLSSDALRVAFAAVPDVTLVDDFGLFSRGKRYVLETSLHETGGKLRFTFTLRNFATGSEIVRHSIDRQLHEKHLAHDQIAILSRNVFECALTGTTFAANSVKDRTLSLYAQMCADSLNDTLGSMRLLEFARQITKLSPDFSIGWSSRAYYSARLSNEQGPEARLRFAEEARQAINRSMLLDRDNSEIFLAKEQLSRHSLEARESFLIKATRSRLLFGGYEYISLARLLESKGDKEGALDAYRSAYDLNPLDPYVGPMLVRALIKSGRNDEATNLLNSLKELWPNEPS